MPMPHPPVPTQAPEPDHKRTSSTLMDDMYTTLFGDGKQIVGEMPDLILPPEPSHFTPPAPEVVGGFRIRPYKQVWMKPKKLPVPGGSLAPPVIDWCDGPYRGTRK